MSIPCKFERSILGYDEHEIIVRSHHPEIYDAVINDLKVLAPAPARHAQQGAYPGAREAPRSARQRIAERRELSWHRRASLAAQAGVRRRFETREQGDRSHAK